MDVAYKSQKIIIIRQIKVQTFAELYSFSICIFEYTIYRALHTAICNSKLIKDGTVDRINGEYFISDPFFKMFVKRT
jgi:hypothetical protein